MATQALEWPRMISGEPIKTIVKVKPVEGGQLKDIKVQGNHVSLVDSNNRQEFNSKEAFDETSTNQQMFDSSFSAYLSPLLQGFNISIFAFGSSNAGKTHIIEGTKRDPGLVLLFGDSLFSLLDNKKYQMDNGGRFAYSVKMQFSEVIDEEVTDLLSLPQDKYGDPVTVNYNEWEGFSLNKCNWISIKNSSQMAEVFSQGKMRRDQSMNEYGRANVKSAGILTFEITQTLESQETREIAIVVSRLSFYDMPGSEILLEDPEQVKLKQGKTINKSIQTVAGIIKDLCNSKNNFIYYEASVLSSLMRESLGGNSLCLGIFAIQNGDLKGSSLALNYQKYVQKITNYPIINDNKSLGLLRQLRSEIMLTSKGKNMGGEGKENLKMVELEKKLIEDNLDKLRKNEEKQRLGQKFSELREKYNSLVKSKSDIQTDLIRSEEEKLEISKALVELQIENTRLLEMLQKEKFDLNNKLISAEGDIMATNIKEEAALKKISELQDRLNDILQEKKEYEIEFVALRKNYIEINNELTNEKKKNENLGIELINLANENKALHDEINDIYKRSGSTNDENSKLINKLEKIDKQNQEYKETLIFQKAEIERLKTEMIKYDIMEKQHLQEVEQKRLELEKGILENNKEKQQEYNRINNDTQLMVQRVKDDKLLWESQKTELNQKIRLLQRRIDELNERINGLIQSNEEIQTENTKMTLQLDEMRSVFRKKLIELMNGTNGEKQSALKQGYEMSAKEELLRSYNEKEIELNERIEKERNHNKHIRQQLKELKNYARNVRYLAEDWAPVGQPLPSLLKNGPSLDNEENQNTTVRILEEENKKLRNRNTRLEEDLNRVNDQIINSDNPSNLQRRLNLEYDNLKNSSMNGNQQSQDYQYILRERDTLFQENKKLVSLLKDTKKWDVYVLQNEIQALQQKLKDREVKSNMGPMSGQNKSIQQKLEYYEKQMKELEKERSELLVRATMAEEQLYHIQQHLKNPNYR